MNAESLDEMIQKLEKIALRADKASQVARDIQEIENVSSRLTFLDAQGKNREVVAECFAQHQPDVCICLGGQIMLGLEKIIHFYCDEWENKMQPELLEQVTKLFPDIPKIKENTMAGWMKMHSMCTPYIIVAGDGKTAKGTWDSPGFVTGIMNNKLNCLWMFERIATDFIKEDGKWRIWHTLGMIQMSTPYEKSWAYSAMEHADRERPDELVVVNEPYNPKKLCGPLTPNFPPQPLPYETFSETFSYGPPFNFKTK